MSKHATPAWLAAAAIALLGAAPALAQSNGDGLRTAWGHPDLGGVWDFRTLTPIERPDELGDKDVLTTEEAAAFEQQALQQWDADRRDGSDLEYGQGSDIERAYNDFWWDYGSSINEDRRTSLIVDPPDGKIPWTPEGRARPGTFDGAFSGIPAAGPEDRALSERCILGFNSGPPVESSAYNNNLQIFQTADTVVIFNEMIHDARIVPLDGRAHLDDGIRQWMGVSRGQWEGDTLVVETTNFLRETHFRGSSANLHLVERFTRIDEDRLLYEYTVSDPTTFTRPWTVQMSMKHSDANLYEYACHEGNYGMFNLLAGARAEEQEAAEAGSK